MRALVMLLLAVPAFGVKVQVEGGAVVELPLERYVAGVLAGESSMFRSDAALRAMAVAARTYAVRMRGRHTAEGYDFCSSTHCQRVDLDGITPHLESIAAATEGEMLWFEGKPALTLYTRDCGGRTEDGGEPYLQSRADPYGTPETWQWDGDPVKIAKALAASGLRTPASFDRITIVNRTASGRAMTLLLGGSVRISAGSFRFAIGRELGWNTVRSDLYEVQSGGGHILFQGRGAGHGVGLCQRGAEQMGAAGKSYRDILAFYYPGTAVGVTARGFAWQRLSGEGLTLWTTHPDRDGAVLAVAVHEARIATERTGWPMPAGVEIRVYPDLDSYRNATGESGLVAAYTQGRRIHMQPAAAVRGTIRHELYHVLVESQAAPGLPLWFREEVVKFLAGQPNSVAHYGEATLLDWVKKSSASVPATKSK